MFSPSLRLAKWFCCLILVCVSPLTITARPDVSVGPKKNGKYLGEGRFNRTGKGQTLKLKTKRKPVVKTFFKLENVSALPAGYMIKGTRGNKNLRAKYFGTGGGSKENVTAEVSRGMHSANVAPEFPYWIEQAVKWSKKASRRKVSKRFRFTAVDEMEMASDTAVAWIERAVKWSNSQ